MRRPIATGSGSADDEGDRTSNTLGVGGSAAIGHRELPASGFEVSGLPDPRRRERGGGGCAARRFESLS